ncbi:MAG TPA: lytic murein transglycosylase, partial [Sphingobium sp.]|nr:lytic murein transglycosylase [Sphingobium sp.]
MLAAAGIAAAPARAETADVLPDMKTIGAAASPFDLRDGDKARYSAIFGALKGERWAEAKAMILALDPQDAVRPVALSELYLARNSPRVELFDLLDLINKAAWLPRADQLSRLAQKRGATILPALPQIQKMVWLGSAPRRQYVAAVKTDMLAQALTGKIQGFINADDPMGAEGLLSTGEAGLSP